MSDGKFRALDLDVEMVAHAHQRLLAALDDLIEGPGLDMAVPSPLPDWTRGHVLTHVINSGVGHTGMLRAAAAGEVGEQYPHGLEGRAADIEEGAGRPAAEQRDDLRRSIYELEAEYARSQWVGTGLAPFGEVQLVDLPFFRMREVAVHHIDLDIGYGFEDLPERYVDADLAKATARFTQVHNAPLPDRADALAAPERLAWLLGRVEVDGLDAAAIF